MQTFYFQYDRIQPLFQTSNYFPHCVEHNYWFWFSCRSKMASPYSTELVSFQQGILVSDTINVTLSSGYSLGLWCLMTCSAFSNKLYYSTLCCHSPHVVIIPYSCNFNYHEPMKENVTFIDTPWCSSRESEFF